MHYKRNEPIEIGIWAQFLPISIEVNRFCDPTADLHPRISQKARQRTKITYEANDAFAENRLTYLNFEFKR